MSKGRLHVRAVGAIAIISAWVMIAQADEAFDRMISNGNYKEAIDYAEEKIPPQSRDASVWMKLAKANDALGMTEKALACYLVSWRLNPNDYQSLLGAARVYNKLSQPDNALNMAKKALDINFTPEASWEYARACIALNRSVEAKQALEKVIESDPSNEIANRELGNIYYNEKAYTKALPLMKKSMSSRIDGETAFRLGKAYMESNIPDSAFVYLKKAIDANTRVNEASLELARAYFGLKNYPAAATEFERASKNGSIDALDYYKLGFSKTKNNDPKGALIAYQEAVEKFAGNRVQEALLAREVVGRDLLDKKNFNTAQIHFEFIIDADPRATIVPDIYFLLADVYQGQNNGPRAISSLEKAISLNSKNIEAYARLADLYAKNGLADKAKKTYETMMSLSPNDPNVYLILGQYNLKAKKYSEALSMLEKSYSLRQGAPASEGIAIAAYNLDQFDKARDAAKAAIDLDAQLWDARLILMRVLLRDQNYRAAQEHLEIIVKKEPFTMEYLEKLALCYEKNDLKEKLFEVDKRIATQNKSNVDARLRIARYADSKNDLDVALQYYKEVAVLNPKSADVCKRIYEIATKKNYRGEAIVYLKKYLTLVPEDAEAQRDLGDALYGEKDYDGALVAYRTALKINPSIKGFYKRYAEIVIAKGQQDEVINALSGVIKSGEADFGTYTTLGMIYQKKGNFAKGIEMYQKALQLDPQNIDALSALGSCQAGSGDINGAIITYEQAVMMSPQASNEYKELGDLYLKQNKFDEAVRAYKNYLNKVPGDMKIGKLVGEYYFNRKNYTDAVKYLAGIYGKDNSDVELPLVYGQANLYSGKFKEAITILEELRGRKAKGVRSRELLKSLAEAYEKDGRDGQAAIILAEYIKLPSVRDPDAAYKVAYLQEKTAPAAATAMYENNIKDYALDYRNFLRLGLLYSSKTETIQKAVPLLRRTTELADSVPVVWLELGKLYGKLGKETEELQAYRKYVEVDPQNLEANKRMGIILVNRGQTTEGLVYLEMANTLSPNDPAVMAVLAKGYLKTGRQNEAISLLERAKSIKRDDADIRFQLFELYTKAGRSKDAQQEIKELVELKRDNKFLMMYASALIDQEKYKDAENILEDILATKADDIDALMLKAKVQRAKKKYDDAIETYKEISFVIPEHAPSLYERAETYMELSKPQWAETFYKRALRANPNFGLAELGLAKLAKIRKDIPGYQEHLSKARQLDPDNPQIREEWNKANPR